MLRANLNDLLAFVAVAKEQSFTKAAAKLGVSQSALSHTMRSLESRLGVRLLTRTTRSVSTTAAGERLINIVAPHFDQIEGGLIALGELRDKPAGAIRIVTSGHASETVLVPALQKFLPNYPDIQVEVVIDHGLTDIVAERYDAGIRLGESVEKDMIAVSIGPEIRMALIGSPGYFQGREKPASPRDLTSHNCINIRMPSYGGLYAWEFEKDGQELKVRVEGQLTFNVIEHIFNAALAGLGLAFVPEDMAIAHISEGRLVRILDDWCPPFPGYHLYYPSRRQSSAAFQVLMDALRYRAR